MSTRYRVVTVGLLVLALVAALVRVFSSPRHLHDLQNGIYTVSPGHCDLHYPLVTLRYSEKIYHQVEWYSDDGNTYTVVFPTAKPGTPFGDGRKPRYEFAVASSGYTKSGKPVVTGDPYPYFPYFIKDASGNVCKAVGK